MTDFKFEWDHFSDQPHPIRDKNIKKRMYRRGVLDTLKTAALTLVIFPIAYFSHRTFKRKTPPSLNRFFGLSVNLHREKNKDIVRLIEELGCDDLLIRIYLHDIENLDKYIHFAEKFKNKRLVIAVLQDRRHVIDEQLWRASFYAILNGLSPFTNRFQIGHAINRKKWAFLTHDEFLKFYEIAQAIRDEHFPTIKLLGPSVIDFEFYSTIRSLFNFYNIKYDELSSLLYVDRRGAPENKQMQFDLLNKLSMLSALIKLSSKTNNKLVITETNWPIKNRGAYSPTSEVECVSLDHYKNYMIRYYLLAVASEQVEQVFWHQLIAPGYGLVDDRYGLAKYPAFEAFKFLLKALKDTEFLDFSYIDRCYTMRFSSQGKLLYVIWSNDVILPLPLSLSKINYTFVYDACGNQITKVVEVSGSPIFLIE